MAIEETTAQLQERLRLAEEELQSLSKNTDEYKKQELYIKGINEELKKTSDYYQSHLEAAKKLADSGKDLLDVKQKELQLSVSLAEKAVEKAIQDGESADQLEKLVLKLKEAEEAYENLNRARSSGKALANLLGIDESNKNSLTYQIFANPSQVMKGFTDEVEDAGGAVQSVMLSAVMKIQEMTVGAFVAYDQASVSIAKIAGYNKELLGVLNDTSRGATAFGVSFAEAGKAIEGLYTNLNTFSNLNVGAKEQLTISAAKLDRLGIASQESAKQIGTLTQIMGMSEVQAGKTSEELAGFALAIGKPPQQVAQDFAAASNQLAAYGNNMVNVFKDLEIQSKATNVAVGDLIAIAEKFQTFEGAAQAAGKLNAALGGGFINSMELLEASAENPAKAIDLLRTRLDEAGLSFNQMSFYEQKMIADAAGFKTIEEASRVLSMSNAEAEKAARVSAERANEQKLLNDAIQKSIPIQEKLQMIAANFAIVMGPVIDKFSMFLSFVLELVDALGPLNYILIFIVASFTAMFIIGKVAIFIQAAAAAFSALFAASSTAAPAAAGGAAALNTVAGAAQAAAGPILELGVAMFVVAAAIGLAAAGLGLMYMGIGSMIESFVKLFSVLANTDSIADSLFTLSLAMGAVGLIFTNPFVMGGLLVFSAALAGIVFTLNKLDKDKSFNFATITKSIAELNVKTTTGPNNAMKQTGELITAINSFSLSKDNTAGLEKILKAAMPQQQQAGSTYSPTIIVKIGDKQIRNLVVEVVEPIMGATATTL
jgi:hypothetical protein